MRMREHHISSRSRDACVAVFRGKTRWATQALQLLLILLSAGCAHNAGEIFPKLKDAPQWPAAPAEARIRYVGQLTGSQDLKPAESPMQILNRAVFGGTPAVFSLQTPMAVCTDGADRVFIADSGDHIVHMLDLKTRVYQRWAPTGVKMLTPVGLAYDANGRRLLVSDSGAAAIFSFSLDGQYLGQFASGQVKRPCGLTIDPHNGRVFVADVAAHQIVVLSASGQVIERLGARGDAPGQFNYPTNVALDSQDRLYVSDSLNFRIQQFSPNLEPLRQMGKQGDMPGYFAEPKGLAIDPDGHIYVVDSQFEAVQLFDNTGNLLMDFGEEGRGPGEFWLPSNIFIDGHGRIWVADSYNHRVQVFDYLPEKKP